MTILTRIFASIDIITGLISICVQAVIIASYGDCAHSKMGVGIWNGILLLITATVLLVICFQKAKMKDSILVLCGMSLMASLLQAGIACGVIYQINSLQYFEHEVPDVSRIRLTDIMNGNFDTVTNMGRHLAKNGLKHIQVRTCYSPSLDETYTGGDERKSLEYVLLACGLVATLVQIASLAVVREKHFVVSATIQYKSQVAAGSNDDMLKTSNSEKLQSPLP